MIELTPQQLDHLRTVPESPPRVVNPHTGETFVLVAVDVYARLQQLLAEDITPADAYPAIDRAFAPGWDDPRMDDYDRYEEIRK
jgi:hypothetical protein